MKIVNIFFVYFSIFLVSIGFLGYSLVTSFNEIEVVNKQIHNIEKMTEKTRGLLYLSNKKFSIKKIKQIRKSIENEERKKNYSKLIKSYSKERSSLFPKYWQTFLNKETGIKKQLKSNLADSERAMQFHFILICISIFIFLGFIFFKIKNMILKPISVMKNQMMDLSNRNYIYQFQNPKNNELGDLQRSFDSVSQIILNQMEELEFVDKAKSEFLSVVSHELRTPLTSLKGSLNLLNQKVQESPSSEELLKIAELETDRLIRLVNDILDLTKIQTRKFPLKESWWYLEDIVMNTQFILKGLCKENNISIISSGLENIEVYADKDRIQQVMTNLTSNAIRHSPHDSIVQIDVLAKENNELKVKVRDKGCGIPLDEQKHIFDKFRQSKNHVGQGMGLGLAIAKALVKEHKGDIGVKSQEGEGSVFYFSIPKWRKIKEVRKEICKNHFEVPF